MTLSKLILLISTLLTSTLAAPQKSRGCGISHKDLSLPAQHLDSSGQNRSYYIHLPSTYNSDTAYPLVLGFHGSPSSAMTVPLDTKLNNETYSGSKIMVYPEGAGESWAGPTYHNATSVGEDVQFVADVIANVENRFCVDEARVFAFGMSNGGGFVGTLACDEKGSSLFTGLAAHSGAFYTDVNGPDNGCAPSKEVPLLEIHGGADKDVPYAGGKGEGGELPSIFNWLNSWALRYKCESSSVNITFGSEVRHWSWGCDGKSGLLQHYEVMHLGHAWADTEPNFSQSYAQQGPTVIQASRIIMDFFDSV
ncbi:carbohydrate esterase family 1 protein [Bipolaris sorokiniana ND90Pr]|uniref:feruloyl esterase n=1 Tax=Cochliobolus sativus (strain ND90Pr / ATCC 201652) TaxID=665912 RepID=M2T545_COCSN|nr:carbohydrate esterase family 1 protein [Bipolaris sorokiniana ND90Pr]EMD64381.1 carbohydrate esterase family 1 protein [Bipolaris sorokiniana ND90Pr]